MLGVLLFAGADVLQRKFIPPRNAGGFHLKTPNKYSVFGDARPAWQGGGDFHLMINSRGIRGPEWPARAGAYRVLCVGDSVTECLYLDDRKAWPALVMDRLNQEKGMPRVWVGNVGESGYTSYHHLLFLKESALIREIDCVVLLVGTVDLVCAVHGSADVVKLPRARKSKSWFETFFKQARKRLSPERRQTAAADADGEGSAAHKSARTEAGKSDALPDLTAPLERHRQWLREIADVCRAHGVRLVLASTATPCRNNLRPEDTGILWGGKMADGRYLSEAAVVRAFDAYNAATADAAREKKVEFADLSRLSGRTSLFCDIWHFNEEGCRQVSRLVAEYFLGQRQGHGWQPAAARPLQNWK